MPDDSPLAVLWRQRWLIVAVVAVFTVVAVAVSASMQKVYAATSTLLVAVAADNQSFDSVQAGQAFARSYVDIIASPNTAERVARRVGGGTDKDDLLAAVSFKTVPETQLMKVTAEDPSPARAKRIADAYAAEFTDYARRTLVPHTQAAVTLADAAPLPDQPVRPRPLLYAFVAFILGLALAVLLAFARDRIDRRLRTPEDVESRIGRDVPIVGRVPARGRSEQSVAAFEEAHRILRKNLEFASVELPLRSVAVTSAQQHEGKTTTVVQLAKASAELGYGVIIVDADFRDPGMPAELPLEGHDAPYPGLSNYLMGMASLDQVVRPTVYPGVAIVPAGAQPPSGSALLESEGARDLVPELLSRAELVLLDCPPVNAGADASILAGKVDGVLFVIDLKSSTDRAVSAALRQLRAVRSALLGLVLNRDASVPVHHYPEHLRGSAARAAEPELRD
jgi:capsular exopolysaccharide synthesis family protein